MKIKQLTTLKHKLQWLLLLAALLGVSQGVLGATSTYYFMLYKGNTNTYTSLVNQGGVTAENIFTWNLNIDSYGNYYFAISTTSSNANIIDDQDATNRITNNTGGLNLLSSIERNNWSGKYMYRVAFSKLGDVTLTYNKSANSYTWAEAGGESSAPVIRMGYMPQNEDNNDVTVSGYVASRGCNNGSTGSITGFTIYYSKTSFSTGSESGVYTKSISAPSGITPSESPARNSVYSMVIPAEDLADNGWRNGNPLYVRIKATNDADLTSDISDIQNITYTLCANMINEVYLLPAEGAVVTGSTLSLLPSVDNTEAVGVVYTWEKNDVAWGTGDSKSVTANANVKIKVTASESTCNSSASVTHNYTVCTPAITNLTISGCPAGDVGKGSSVTLTASTETGTPSSWAWYLDGISTGGTDNSYTFTPSAAVDYTAKVVAEGCPDRKLDAVCVIRAKSTFTVPSPAMAPTFNACKDHHQFIWSGESGMFNPAPERYDVCVGSEPGGATDAYGEFEMLGSKYMVWKPGNKAAGTYTYCFTAHRTGYISKSTTLTITYQKTASAQGINSITIDGTAYAGEPYPEVMPWTPATLATSIPAGSSEITSIKWTVSPTGPQISPTNSNATTAEFKGRAVDEKTLYTITATGLTSTCGEGGSSTTKIYVKPEAAERCD